MKRSILSALALLASSLPAMAQEGAPAPPPPMAAAPEPPAETPPPPSDAPVYDPNATPEAAPPPAEWTRDYPGGRWVYTIDYGWIWIPTQAQSVTVETVPYAYLYTPTYGWTWYVSPWGFGAYTFGPWVRHVWRPAGWHHGWVAHPRVIVHVQRAHAMPMHGGGHFRHR